MTRYLRTALGAIAAVGVVLAASAAIAHSGGMQGGMSEEMGMRHQSMHSRMSGSEHGGKHMGGAQQLMTPAEREALHDKMRAARTPEERQALAAATRAEMEKRAKEKGIALPEHRGGGGKMGQGPGAGVGGHQH